MTHRSPCPVLARVVGVVLLVLVGSLAGAAPVTITFWDTMGPDEQATLRGILDDFAVASPEIKVRLESVPFTDAQAKFEFAAAANVAPDVLRCEIAWTPLYADLGFLTPLENLVTTEELADYLPVPLAYNVYAGHLWGLPQVTDCLAIIYNKAICAAAVAASAGTAKTPDQWQTYADFVATARAVARHQQAISNTRYAMFLRGDAYFVQPWLWLFGGGLLSPDRRILIDAPASIAGLEAFLALKNEPGVAPREVDFANDYDNAMKALKSGEAAMIVNGPWAISDLLTGAEFNTALGGDPNRLGVAVIPRQVAHGSPVGGHNYVISRCCKDVAAALTFIRFMNEPQHQVRLATRNQLLPTRRSAYSLLNQQNFLSKPILLGFKRQLDVANNRPVIPEGGRLYPDFTRHFQKVFRGEITATECTQRIAHDWRALLGDETAAVGSAPVAARP